MQKLDKTTKLKLLIPFAYFVVTNILFVVSLEGVSYRHQIPGLLTANIAFVLWLTARIQLGNAFSIGPKSKFLVKSGLYAKLRHPVYYFSILAVVGIGVFLWSPAALLVVVMLTALEISRIRKEEALLTKVFGKEYSDYKRQTWF